jgi:hypothetical protein
MSTKNNVESWRESESQRRVTPNFAVDFFPQKPQYRDGQFITEYFRLTIQTTSTIGTVVILLISISTTLKVLQRMSLWNTNIVAAWT